MVFPLGTMTLQHALTVARAEFGKQWQARGLGQGKVSRPNLGFSRESVPLNYRLITPEQLQRLDTNLSSLLQSVYGHTRDKHVGLTSPFRWL